MNPHLRLRLEAILTQLQAAHDGGDAMSYATRGNEREAFVDLLLRGCLPGPYRFGSGEVTDAYGGRSGQIDLVIEHPFFPSFPLLGTSQHRLYLIESVAMGIEVKSSTGQFDKAVETMQKFRELIPEADFPQGVVHRFPQHGARGQGIWTSFPGRLGFAIVFYRGWKDAATLKRHCDEHDVDVVLQLSPPIFYARRYRVLGHDSAANEKIVLGCEALAAFLLVVTEELRSVSHWDSNIFRRYVEQVPSPDFEPAPEPAPE